MPTSKRSLVFKLSVFSLVLHLIAICLSFGIFYYDEHWQILEFLNLKLGRATEAQMPWEYGSQARPWLQPGFYWILTQVYLLLGKAFNPYTLSLLFRLISGLLGWASVVCLLKCSEKWIKDSGIRRFAQWSLALTYFLPLLHARHSSENLSGTFIVFGVALLTFFSRSVHFLIAGMLFGLAFEFRVHVCFAIFGFCLWGLLLRKIRIKNLAILTLGFIAVVLLSFGVDRWGYGQWTFPPWNYFHKTIIESVGDSWGVSPWWDFFPMTLRMYLFGLGYFVLLGWVLGWICAPTHPLSWITFFFFMGHSMIAHKEGRFLFPIFPFAFLTGFIGLENLMMYPSKLANFFKQKGVQFFARGVFGFFIFINLIAYPRSLMMPLHPAMRLLQKVYHYPEEPSLLIFYKEDPTLNYGFRQTFYVSKELEISQTENPTADVRLRQENSNSPKKSIYFYALLLRKEIFPFEQSLPRCKLIDSEAEDLGVGTLFKGSPLQNLGENTKIRRLYDCTP